MKELKLDHQKGMISDEKYKELSRQYMIKLKNIDASSRIRTMQGRKQHSKYNSSNVGLDKKAAELSRLEDEKLVQKYIVNPKRSSNQKPKYNSNNTSKLSIIAVVFLIIAFTAGIGFGMLNFDFKTANISNASAIVTDDAFPAEILNTTNSSLITDSSSDTDTGSSGSTISQSDTSVDSDSGSSISDSGGSDNGGSSDSGGSDNGGSSDSGGSDNGGSSDTGGGTSEAI